MRGGLGALSVGLGLLTATGTGNAQTWVSPADGQVMLLVPAGELALGSSQGPLEERPGGPVYVPAFYVGRTEVTVGQFRRFIRESGYGAGTRWQEQAQQEDWPVTGVTWLDARSYCDWAGLRLPSEAEWEKAARGTDARSWPWGSDWNARAANVAGADDGFPALAPVGSLPEGASPYGCLDMAGNVWEWTASLYRPYPYDPYDGREDYAAPGLVLSAEEGGRTMPAGRARPRVSRGTLTAQERTSASAALSACPTPSAPI